MRANLRDKILYVRDMVSALEEGWVDIGTFLQPFYEQARDAVGGLNYLYDFATPFGNIMTFFMIMKNDVIEEKPRRSSSHG